MGSGGAFAAAVVLAAVVRGANVWWFRASPAAEHLISDHAEYDNWAQRIAAGDWVGHGVFWIDPLYAYVLAAIYKLFGRDLTLVRAFHCALGVASVVLAGAIARRISGRAAVGNAAMFVAALFVPLLHNELQIEKATLTTLVAAAALAVFLRGTRRATALAGLLTGLGVLGRGNLLLMVPAGFLALLFERHRAPPPQGRGPSGRPRAAPPITRESLTRAALFAAAAAAVIGVLTVRNVVVAREFLLTTSIGGPAFYAAQLAGYEHGAYESPSFVRPIARYEHEDFHAEAVRRVGRPMSDTEVNAYWMRRGIDEVLAHPGATLARSLTRLRLAFHQWEVPDNDEVETAALYSPLLRLPLFWFGQVMPFAALGTVAWWRRSRAARVTAVAVAVYVAGLVMFYVVGRMRLPVVVPVIALATAGAAWWIDRARALDARGAVGGAALVVVGLVVCMSRPAWMVEGRTSGLMTSYANLGSQCMSARRFDEAITAYERAVAINPEFVLGLRRLGDLYLGRRRYADAERAMRLVLHHKPSSPLGHAALIRLYETMARDPSTGGAGAVRARLADAYRAAGQQDDAARLLNEAAPRAGAGAP
jgi:tetratricopeptide (TPR) repeat protein